MTKTLTEQWRDGELDEGWYYVVREWDDEIRMLYFEGDYFLDTDVPLDNDNIKEVLAPVPSYDELEHTKAKLKKATELNFNHAYKTNKRRIQINNLKNENNQLREQLKEKNIKLNELRHQRNEANEVIKLITTENRDCYNEAREYLEKWGVK